MWGLIVLIVLVVAVIWWHVVAGNRYYKKLYSEAHFREVYDSFVQMVKRAEEKCGKGPADEQREHYVTSAGLVVVVTVDPMGSGKELHVSMSQRGTVTLHAVSEYFGGFFLNILSPNKIIFTPFFTESQVHHLVFRYNGELMFETFEEAYRQTNENPKRIPYEFHPMNQEADR